MELFEIIVGIVTMLLSFAFVFGIWFIIHLLLKDRRERGKKMKEISMSNVSLSEEGK